MSNGIELRDVTKRRRREDEPRRQSDRKGIVGTIRARVGTPSVPRHEALRAASPPKRRSRVRYSAIAPSSVARSKSGQNTGTNTSSL